MPAAKAHLPPVHFSWISQASPSKRPVNPFLPVEMAFNPCSLVRHPVVPELALQPLPRARLDPIAIDQFRLIVRAQEEYRRVSRAHRRRIETTMPGDGAVEARFQLKAGEEFERVADVDDGAVGTRGDVLPC